MKTRDLFKVGICGMGLYQGVFGQTAADSGWISLFDGTTLNGLYAYIVGTGQVNSSAQTAFTVQNGMIVSPGSTGKIGYIGTINQYSRYHVSVEYMWPTGTAANANSGLLVHLDSAAVFSHSVTTANRPRSIEVNMKRDPTNVTGSNQTAYGGDPFTLWSAASLGPYITTTVDSPSIAGPRYLSTGTTWTDDPWGNRTIFSTVHNPEKPLGQWNVGEAYVYGADSGTFILNGVIRTRGWNFQNRANIANANPRVPCTKGNIGLQSESGQLFFRNFRLQILDSITGKPVGLLNWERNRKLSGRELMVNASGERWIDIPKSYSGVELFNLRGRLVWSRRGSDTRAVIPASVEKGILRTRFMP